MDPAVITALIAELGKKTSVCWLRYSVYGNPPTEHAVWHVWHEDALLLVSEGSEQPLPDITDAEWVEVTMRSKETGGRLVTWVGVPQRVLPKSEGWPAAAAALASARISIPSLSETPKEWANTSVITRIEPSGEVLEAPGSLSDESHAAVPRPTGAITRGALPRILHRRKKRRPKLS
ncbi:MAG TPA: hypothetical protein VLI04_14305 [Nocardioidaceae bacterium]|nr:hypothetical protein [Nocardioidaceae bacterium]